MKKNRIKNRTNVSGTITEKGIWLSENIRNMMEAEEGINATIPVEYTRPQDGRQPQYDIRTDRFEVMQNGMDRATKQAKTNYLKRLGGGTEGETKKGTEE